MDSKEYILNHNFGYGREPQRKRLKKLILRKIEDFKFYLHYMLDEVFYADVSKSNIISFLGSDEIVKVVTEYIDK